MKKIIFGTVLIIAIVICVFLPSKDNIENNKPVVKIGVMGPLSGDMALLGQPLKGAVETAIEDANKGDNKYRYELVIEDNQLNNAKSATILSKITSIDNVDAVLTVTSPVGKIASEAAEKNKFIHISSSSDANVARGKYNFINWTMPEYESEKLVTTVAEKGYKNVAIVTINQEGGIAAANALAKELDKYDIKNSSWYVNMGTKDMRMDIKKMQNTNPDLYVLILYSPENVIFIKQLKETGDKTELTAIETFEFIEDLRIIDGTWYVTSSEANNEVMDRIRAKNKSNMTYSVGQFYDNVMMIKKAFEEADTKEQAVDALIGYEEYHGVSGLLKQDENGIFNGEPVVKRVVNGTIVIEE